MSDARTEANPMTDQRTHELDPPARWMPPTDAPAPPAEGAGPAAPPVPPASWAPPRFEPAPVPRFEPSPPWPPAGPPTGAVAPSFPPVVPGPPSVPSGAGTGGPGALPPAPPPASLPRRRRAGAVLAAAAVFVAGAGGVLVGRQLADDPSSPSAVGTRPVVTVPGPVTGSSEEPAAAVAAAVAPAVVQIETDQGLGSGFIYDRSGLILTASHVTDGAQTVQVRLADGTRLEGTVVGSDAATDVAVVRIPAGKDLPVASLATGVPLEVGQMAVAIGSPFGLDQTVTAGIVSAVGRSTETPGGVIPAIQTDAPINSGNSGGALADREGRIIGINDSIITGSRQSSGNVGVGFAIPIDIAKVVADKIVAGRPTASGYLGVRGADANGQRAGAVLTDVEAGSPAAKAGLTADDVVVEADGRKVASMIDLAAIISTNQPGETISLTVVRGGQERTVRATLGTAP